MWNPYHPDEERDAPDLPRWLVPWAWPFGVILVALVAFAVTPYVRATPTEPAVIAGVLELTGDGWRAVGGNHVALGVASVESDGERITIHFNRTYGRVITFIADPDGPMVQAGYSAGATTFLDRAEIELARHGEPASPAEAVVRNGNIWFYGLMEP